MIIGGAEDRGQQETEGVELRSFLKFSGGNLHSRRR